MTPEDSEKFNRGRYAFVAVCAKGKDESGFTIGVAIEDSPGYYPLNYHSVPTYEEASKWAEGLNERRSLIVASSFRKGVAP